MIILFENYYEFDYKIGPELILMCIMFCDCPWVLLILQKNVF